MVVFVELCMILVYAMLGGNVSIPVVYWVRDSWIRRSPPRRRRTR